MSNSVRTPYVCKCTTLFYVLQLSAFNVDTLLIHMQHVLPMFSLMDCIKKYFWQTQIMPAPKQSIDIEKLTLLAEKTEELSKCLHDFVRGIESKNRKSIEVSGWKRIIGSLEQAKKSLSVITGSASDLAAINFLECLPAGETVYTRPTKVDLKVAESQVKTNRNQHKK